MKLKLKQAYTLDPKKSSGLTMVFSHGAGTYQGNELTRNSSGNIRSELSQLAEPLWTDPDLKSGISERELISTSKKKKKKSAGGE